MSYGREIGSGACVVVRQPRGNDKSFLVTIDERRTGERGYGAEGRIEARPTVNPMAVRVTMKHVETRAVPGRTGFEERGPGTHVSFEDDPELTKAMFRDPVLSITQVWRPGGRRSVFDVGKATETTRTDRDARIRGGSEFGFAVGSQEGPERGHWGYVADMFAGFQRFRSNTLSKQHVCDATWMDYRKVPGHVKKIGLSCRDPIMRAWMANDPTPPWWKDTPGGMD
jgi:hypothetical protein